MTDGCCYPRATRTADKLVLMSPDDAPLENPCNPAGSMAKPMKRSVMTMDAGGCVRRYFASPAAALLALPQKAIFF